MKKKENSYILVIGISIYDIFGFSYATYRPYDSNPGKVKVSCGGVCRNIAENMARVGVNTKFISVIGDDSKGKEILRKANEVGMDMTGTLIVEGGSTPTYLAILDENGEMVSAVVDTKLANAFSNEALDERAELIKGAEYVFIGADNPPFIEHLVKTYYPYTRFVLDPVSAAKAVRIKKLLPYLHTLKPNRYEAEALCGFKIKTHEDMQKAGAYLLRMGIKKVFISLDTEGVYYNDGQKEGLIKASCTKVVNVTGAGDAFVAGLGTAYMDEMSIQDTVQFAISMSNLTIAYEETIDPDLTRTSVEEYKNQADWDILEFK